VGAFAGRAGQASQTCDRSADRPVEKIAHRASSCAEGPGGAASGRP